MGRVGREGLERSRTGGRPGRTTSWCCRRSATTRMPPTSIGCSRSWSATSPGGTVLACHRRHAVEDHPESGDAVHAAFARWPRLSRVEEDFLLDVLAPGVAPSVVRPTGWPSSCGWPPAGSRSSPRQCACRTGRSSRQRCGGPSPGRTACRAPATCTCTARTSACRRPRTWAGGACTPPAGSPCSPARGARAAASAGSPTTSAGSERAPYSRTARPRRSGSDSGPGRRGGQVHRCRPAPGSSSAGATSPVSPRAASRWPRA